MLIRSAERSGRYSIERSDLDEPYNQQIFIGEDAVRWLEGRLGLPFRTFGYAQVAWVDRNPRTQEVDWDNVELVFTSEWRLESTRQQLSYPGETEIGDVWDLTRDP
jgi:hypothetical protein